MVSEVGLRYVIQDLGAAEEVQRLRDRLNDRTALHRELADALMTRVDQRFDLGQDPSGVAWTAWRPSTVKARARKGLLPGRLLVAHTPGMRSSLSSEADASSGRVGFASPHAVYHEHGTRKMVRRGLLMDGSSLQIGGGLADRDAQLLLRVLRDYLEQP